MVEKLFRKLKQVNELSSHMKVLEEKIRILESNRTDLYKRIDEIWPRIGAIESFVFPNEKFITEEQEFRKGCSLFESTLVFHHQRIQICCSPLTDTPDFFFFPYESGSEESLKNVIKKYHENKEILLEKWRKMDGGQCSKCTHLTEGMFPSKPKVNTLHFPTGYDGSHCNFKCCYCNADAYFEDNDNCTNNLYETIVQLSDFFDFSGMFISFSNGEFVTRKDADQILDFLFDKGAILSLVSNSSVYKESVVRFIRSGRMNGINTSLDAGTKETFAKVKGVDCWEKVIGNIFRYSQLGCRYFLKYIILEDINDNEIDINGFVDVCMQVKAAEVTISADKKLKMTRLSQNALYMVILLNNRLLENKFKILFSSNDFNPDDLEYIYSHIIS